MSPADAHYCATSSYIRTCRRFRAHTHTELMGPHEASVVNAGPMYIGEGFRFHTEVGDNNPLTRLVHGLWLASEQCHGLRLTSALLCTVAGNQLS